MCMVERCGLGCSRWLDNLCDGSTTLASTTLPPPPTPSDSGGWAWGWSGWQKLGAGGWRPWQWGITWFVETSCTKNLPKHNCLWCSCKCLCWQVWVTLIKRSGLDWQVDFGGGSEWWKKLLKTIPFWCKIAWYSCEALVYPLFYIS